MFRHSRPSGTAAAGSTAGTGDGAVVIADGPADTAGADGSAETSPTILPLLTTTAVVLQPEHADAGRREKRRPAWSRY